MSAIQIPAPTTLPEMEDVAPVPSPRDPSRPLDAVLGVFALGAAAYANFPLCLAAGKAVAILSWIFVAYLANPKGRASWARAGGVGLLSFAALATMSQPWQVPVFVALPLLLVPWRSLPVAVRTVFVPLASFLAFLLAFDASGFLWQAANDAAWRATAFLTGKLGPVQRLGYVHTGVVWAYLGLGMVGQCLAYGPRNLRRAALVGGFVLAGMLLNLATASDWPLVGCLCGSAFLLRTGPSPAPSRRRAALVFASAVTAFLLLAAFCFPPAQAKAGRKEFWIVSGGLMTLKIDAGAPDDPAPPAEAVFGGLGRMLTGAGWTVRTVQRDALAPTLESSAAPRLLCVVNPQEIFGVREQDAVKRYVAEGGRLIVLGDHTDIQGIRAPLNSLLGFTDIRYRFDSAIYADEHPEWRTALRTAWASGFAGLDGSALDVSIGASLECGPKARVLLSGEEAYGDEGDYSRAGSHLGDMLYNLGERYGGLAMVAEEAYGRGVVQVWGDTSGFQDPCLTDDYPFLFADFDHLASENPAALSAKPIVALAPVAAVAALVLAPGSEAVLALVAAAGVLVLSVLPWAAAKPAVPITKSDALYDVSHGARYPHGGVESGTFKLRQLFLRKGGFLYHGTLDDLDKMPRWVVVAAPTVPYTTEEARRLRRYVEDGGRLVLTAGYEERQSCAALLDAFGARIEASPLGRAVSVTFPDRGLEGFLFQMGTPKGPVRPSGDLPTPSGNQGYLFLNSYPVQCPGATPLAQCFGESLAVQKRVGRGSFTLIGDDRFVTDENLGETTSVNVVPNRFLYEILG